MWSRVGKRIVVSIPVLVGVVLVIFVMLRIVPGDPVTTMLGEHVNPAVIEKISRENVKEGFHDDMRFLPVVCVNCMYSCYLERFCR